MNVKPSLENGCAKTREILGKCADGLMTYASIPYDFGKGAGILTNYDYSKGDAELSQILNMTLVAPVLGVADALLIAGVCYATGTTEALQNSELLHYLAGQVGIVDSEYGADAGSVLLTGILRESEAIAGYLRGYLLERSKK